MIYRIYSNSPDFKHVELGPGLNVLLADRTPESTEKQTRNRAGKTSLIELIHFLFGANCDKDSIFRTKELVNFSFGAEFDLAGVRTVIERTGAKPSKLRVIRGDFSRWQIAPAKDRKSGDLLISNSDWRTVLGQLAFGLRDAEESIGKFRPTFRSLLGYFVRRQSAGAFSSPFRQAEKQQLWDQQVAVSYLLGLDWTISQRWQLVRERERGLEELRKAMRQGAFGPTLPTSAELRTKLVLVQERRERLRKNMDAFRVLPEYRDLEKEASELTRSMGKMSNKNTVDRQITEDLKQALKEEVLPSSELLDDLYGEATLSLPKLVSRRFEEVQEFHESVIENRRSYLESELREAEGRIGSRERQMEGMDARRSQVMALLRSHGALDQYNKLLSELARVEVEAESTRRQFETTEQLESNKTELEVERGRLLIRLKQDFREQERKLAAAINTFEEVSTALYEEAGSLTISESLNGPQFDVKIHGAKSKGISNVQIFCFDITLAMLARARGNTPGFLVHDSHLFDGVDERQVANAIQIGAKAAQEHQFQYVITMNSDAVPSTFDDDFDFRQYVLPARLTDATEDGGLFGVRFG